MKERVDARKREIQSEIAIRLDVETRNRLDLEVKRNKLKHAKERKRCEIYALNELFRR